MFDPILDKEDIKSLPLYKFSGKVNLIDSVVDLSELAKQIAPGDIIGFDTESKPTFKKGHYNPTSLIQLALSNEVFLVRNLLTGPHRYWMEILADDSIIKVGCGIRDDLRDLRKNYNIELNSFLDLNDLVRQAGYDCQGVRRLAANVLKYRISKNQQVSNWENEELTDSQIIYAATDAWTCREIYITQLEEEILIPENGHPAND